MTQTDKFTVFNDIKYIIYFTESASTDSFSFPFEDKQ